jgi:hypothetical protein
LGVRLQDSKPFYLAMHAHCHLRIDADRRRFTAGVAGGCLLASAGLIAGSGLPNYCSLDRNVDLTRLNARGSTGDTRMDHALIAEFRKIISVMRVNPGFRIIDDYSGGNAFAINRTLILNTQGTVLFGIKLMTEEFAVENGGYAIAGIGAHECAHIFQYFSGYAASLSASGSARPIELHADFLAGYYMAKKSHNKHKLQVFANSLFNKGDFDFNDPTHHGTPDERVAAMEAGFSSAELSFRDAAKKGVKYVKQA